MHPASCRNRGVRHQTVRVCNCAPNVAALRVAAPTRRRRQCRPRHCNWHPNRSLRSRKLPFRRCRRRQQSRCSAPMIRAIRGPRLSRRTTVKTTPLAPPKQLLSKRKRQHNGRQKRAWWSRSRRLCAPIAIIELRVVWLDCFRVAIAAVLLSFRKRSSRSQTTTSTTSSRTTTTRGRVCANRSIPRVPELHRASTESQSIPKVSGQCPIRSSTLRRRRAELLQQQHRREKGARTHHRHSLRKW